MCDEDRVKGDASINQGIQKIMSKPTEAKG